MKEGLSYDDIRVIGYYLGLCAQLDEVRKRLNTVLTSTKSLTPAHRERLVSFLTSTPQTNQDNKTRKAQVALLAFNISGGTSFSLNDLGKTLCSAGEWISKEFAAVLEGNGKSNNKTPATQKLEKKKPANLESALKEKVNSLIQHLEKKLANLESEFKEKANKEALSLQKLEERIAKIEADFTEFMDRQSRDSAQRVEDEIKRKAKEQGLKIPRAQGGNHKATVSLESDREVKESSTNQDQASAERQKKDGRDGLSHYNLGAGSHIERDCDLQVSSMERQIFLHLFYMASVVVLVIVLRDCV